MPFYLDKIVYYDFWNVIVTLFARNKFHHAEVRLAVAAVPHTDLLVSHPLAGHLVNLPEHRLSPLDGLHSGVKDDKPETTSL